MKTLKFIGKIIFNLVVVGWMTLGTSLAILGIVNTLEGGDQ